MNHEQERTAEDVHKTMMLLELKISNDKILIRENNLDEKAIYSFSEHTFSLLIKRFKHSYYVKGEYDKGDKLEEIVRQYKEPINHTISANASMVMMNLHLYQISLEDTFLEISREYAEYLKPLLEVVSNNKT
ncbi:MAG: hypothetical protein NTU98_04370 [Bacteroidetes bacterium]|nr:hypothetical protein [Bacteroidota bacterium]